MALRKAFACIAHAATSSSKYLQTKLPLCSQYSNFSNLGRNVSKVCFHSHVDKRYCIAGNSTGWNLSTLCRTYSNAPFSPIMTSIIPQSPYEESRRMITRISKKGKMKTAKMVIHRFRRLGNGLWLRAQCRRQRKLYMVMYRGGGLGDVHRKKRLLLCNAWQSRLLDKMVTSHWKRQKWYVDDPYKGYTEETLHHYHPCDLPHNLSKTKTPEDFDKYGLHRSQAGDKERKQRKLRNYGAVKSNRQKPIPNTNNMRFLH